uniref:EF-hand domain-containing protein n=1 Tax=Hemiselmis andersenii TaxID=464988 RepID=A0A6U2CGF9_HEMAN
MWFNRGLTAIVADLATQVQEMRKEMGHPTSAGGHGTGHVGGHEAGHGDHHFSLATTTVPWFHMLVDCLNLLGVLIMVIGVLGILPTVLFEIFPNCFSLNKADQNQGRMLECRLQLSRGLILGMDLMVVSDVIETLCGHVDLVKLVVIVAVRSWLGYERNKEMEHMEHEFHTWQKASEGLGKHLAKGSGNLDDKIKNLFADFDQDKSGHIDKSELKDALAKVGVHATEGEVAQMMGGASKGITFEDFDKLVKDLVPHQAHQGHGHH